MIHISLFASWPLVLYVTLMLFRGTVKGIWLSVTAVYISKIHISFWAVHWQLIQNLKTKGECRFRCLRCFISDPQEHELMTCKGVFPCSYVKEPAVLLETKLPKRDDFYNDLDCVHITQERYAFAQKV